MQGFGVFQVPDAGTCEQAVTEALSVGYRLIDTASVYGNEQAEAWAPLAEGRNGLFTNAVLSAIGRKYRKTAAQVVLRWLQQRGVVAIPKSVHKERMIENLNVGDFALTEDDMVAIAAMNTDKSLILDLRSTAEVERLYGIECKH